MNRELRNFLSSLTTGHENADFFNENQKCFFPLPISEKFVRIEPPFAQKGAEVVFRPLTYPLRIKMPFGRKTEKIFSVLSPIHLDRKGLIGRKKSKKINPPAEKSARRLLGIEKFTFA